MADPGLSERGVKKFLRKGLWNAAPEAIGICIVEHQNYTLSKATFYDISKNISTGLGFKVDFSKSISIVHSNIKNGS